jgi:hypothetical protein
MSATLLYKVPTFKIRDYSENQVYDFGGKAISMLAPFSGDSVLGAQATALGEFTQELGVKIGRLARDPDVELRRMADQRRDQLKVRLYEMTRIALDDPESETIRKAARVIQDILNRRPVGFQDLIYAENSTELKTLLGDLAEPEAKQALKDAELTKWAQALAAAQTHFEEIDGRISERNRTQTKPRTLDEIRGDFNETLRLVLGNLAWGAHRFGTESPYAVAFRGLRNELAGMQTLEKARTTRQAKKEKAA